MSSYPQGRASQRSEFADDLPSPSSVMSIRHDKPPNDQDVRLPMAQIGMVNKKAQIQGTMMGIAGGLIAGEH